jgi:HAD superfamily hydrolase (TIGR01509 family)
MNSNVRAVLFDVNHTLLGMTDEATTQAHAVRVLYDQVRRHDSSKIEFETFRIAYDDAWNLGRWESFDAYREVKYETIVARALDELGIRFDAELLERILQRYMEPLYQASYVIPGIREILEDLSTLVKLGAITNYKYANGMCGMLRRTNLLQLLDAIVISSKVGWKKPAPAIYEAMLQQLEVEAQQCVLVGNELEKDLWQAGRLGMTTVLFTPAEHEEHDVEFSTLLKARLAGQEAKCDFSVKSAGELHQILREIVK